MPKEMQDLKIASLDHMVYAVFALAAASPYFRGYSLLDTVIADAKMGALYGSCYLWVWLSLWLVGKFPGPIGNVAKKLLKHNSEKRR